MGYDQQLTPREREVIALVRQGLTNHQIAERLGITADGVKYHVSEVMSKLGAESRYEAAELAAGRRKWWTYAPLAGLATAMLLAIAVLMWGVARSGNDDGEAAQERAAAREAIRRMGDAIARPDEILHSTATVASGDDVYAVEYWVDGELGALREDSWQNIRLDSTIVRDQFGYDAGRSSSTPRPIYTEVCDLTQEAWLVVFTRICLIQTIIGAENYELEVSTGDWEGADAVVISAEGDFVGHHNELKFYIDAASDLPLATVVESDAPTRQVMTYEHDFVPRTPEVEALLDPASLGFE